MAGDRRATMGNVIAQRDIQKVFPADEYSCVGIAGTAGLAVEMVRLFQTELEHYEKIEGTTLSIDGKANRLSALIRANLGMAMRGSPWFRCRGYDHDRRPGPDLRLRRDRRSLRGDRLPLRRLRLDVRARLAQEALARRPGRRRCVTAVIQALYDAADDDSATGGADLVTTWPSPASPRARNRRTISSAVPMMQVASSSSLVTKRSSSGSTQQLWPWWMRWCSRSGGDRVEHRRRSRPRSRSAACGGRRPYSFHCS